MPFLFGLAEALKSTVLSSPCYADGNDGSNLIQMSKNGLSVSMASLFSGSTLQAHVCVCVQGVCVRVHTPLESARFGNSEQMSARKAVAGWSREKEEKPCCGVHPSGCFVVEYFGYSKCD